MLYIRSEVYRVCMSVVATRSAIPKPGSRHADPDSAVASGSRPLKTRITISMRKQRDAAKEIYPKSVLSQET